MSSTHQRLRFFGPHTFTGHTAGCAGSDFGGHYEATATRLLFKDILVTGEGCAGPQKVLPSIGAVTSETRFYRITGRRLELLGRRGHRLAVLRRR